MISCRSDLMALKPQEWDLGELLENSSQIKQKQDEIESMVVQVESQKAILKSKPPADVIASLLKSQEMIAQEVSKLAGYASLKTAAHTDDDAGRALSARFSQNEADIGNRLMFFTHWWKDVDEAYAKQIMESLPRFRQFLFEIRRAKPHILTEPEEKIINLKDITGKEALIKQYDAQTSTYRFNLKVKGKNRSLIEQQMHGLITSPDAKMRTNAYQEYHRIFSAHQNELGDLYRSLVIDWKQDKVQLRKFTNPIGARNFGNDIPDDAIEKMIRVIRKRNEIFQDYFRLKAKMIGVKKMSREHIYAPIHTKQKCFPFDKGVKMVMDSYQRFSPKMRSLAMNVIDKHHLDSQVRPNKEGGAFCSTPLPSLVPYVLQSYDSRWNDVSTLAHELGHAIHSQLAGDKSIFTAHAPLPLAETASIFGEILLEKGYLETLKSQKDRTALIAHRLDGLYAAITRQAYFVLFEQEAHKMIGSGSDTKDVSEMYLKNLKEQFGKDMAVPDHFKFEWLRVSHFFHYPFYVYAYSFGNLLVLGLYKRYVEEGPSFVPKYLKLLSYGGSERPEKMLGEIGVDMHDTTFWDSGMDVVQGMVKELRREL